MSDLLLRVASVAAEAKEVLRVELVDPAGTELPPFEPGAHLAVQLPGGLARHYSLCNDPRERHRYVLGVGRSATSRGGSAWLHGGLKTGADLRCSRPINNFRLDASASRYVFVAGGIGITPIMAMVRWCEAHGREWRLYYAARSRQRLAFYEELREFGPRVRFHCDDDAGAPLPVPSLMAEVPPEAQVYCCGPAPLMTAVQSHGSHLPPGALHFEWFSAPAADAQAPAPAAGSFEIELKRSGGCFTVPPDQSVLEVLEANGHEVPFSCREGLCGTCETVVCEGEPDHRDYVYSEAQREGLRSMMVCVSRAKSPRLVLDL